MTPSRWNHRAQGLIACVLALVLACALATGCAPARSDVDGTASPGPELTTAAVTRIVDGDTIHVRLASTGAREKVRLIGIDTPEVAERAEPFGEQASAYTRQALAMCATVYLETDAELRDDYGRLLAYVWLTRPAEIDAAGRPTPAAIEDSMLNARLVADGFAQTLTVPPNVRYRDELRDLQREAREAGRGLWAQ